MVHTAELLFPSQKKYYVRPYFSIYIQEAVQPSKFQLDFSEPIIKIHDHDK